MELSKVKQLTARTYAVGVERVKILDEEKAKEVLTRDDVRKLVKSKAIIIKPKRGTSRGRARLLEKEKRSGRRRGSGSRKGKKTARTPKKATWIKKVRALRRTLKKVKPENYRNLYRRIKGGYFKSKKHLLNYIRGVK